MSAVPASVARIEFHMHTPVTGTYTPHDAISIGGDLNNPAHTRAETSLQIINVHHAIQILFVFQSALKESRIFVSRYERSNVQTTHSVSGKVTKRGDNRWRKDPIGDHELRDWHLNSSGEILGVIVGDSPGYRDINTDHGFKMDVEYYITVQYDDKHIAYLKYHYLLVAGPSENRKATTTYTIVQATISKDSSTAIPHVIS